ncbi:MAG: hypothetical protein PHD95_04140 [Candidatus ainarchaeum sp.]|nr:hypothetical protein [Candidatus ainarchaeum sp.]
MACYKIPAIALFFFSFAFFCQTAVANEGASLVNWVVDNPNSLALGIAATTCMNYPGNNSIVVTVISYPQNTLNPNSTVTATLFEPSGDVNSNIPFSNNSDGTYSKAMNFDANGTFKLAVHAVSDTNAGITGDANAYIYVGSFDMNISFLNNNASYNQGDSGSIRNMVKNSDGNSFVGLSSTTTIFYPSSSVFVLDATMSGLGTGEYYYNFIVPSVSGTYSATSAFSCGLSTDSNSSGRFTVASSSVPPSAPTITPGGGGSGGGEGPASQPLEEEALKIIEAGFDKNLELDLPSSVYVLVSNTGRKPIPFNLSIEIKQGDSVKYSSEFLVPILEPGKTRKIFADAKWTPVLGGSYRILAEASSIDKTKVFSSLIEKFVVGGGIWRYDISAECLKKEVKINETADARIMLLNLGNYYEDTALEWWVENSKGLVIGKSSFTLALYPDENRLVQREVFIPEGTPEGDYIFKAKIKLNGFEQVSFCSFKVKGIGDYNSVLDQLEKNLAGLDDFIAKAKANGIDVSAEEEAELNALKTAFSNLKSLAASGETALLSQKTQEILNGINNLIDIFHAKQLKSGLIKIFWIFIVVQLSLIISLAVLCYFERKAFARLLGLADGKGKYR